jgi:hypothetical protein
VYATAYFDLLKRTEVFCYIACQHQFGLLTEKGKRKVGCSFTGGTVIDFCCIRRPRLWKENTCLGEEVGGPGQLKCYHCMQGNNLISLVKTDAICVFGMLTK